MADDIVERIKSTVRIEQIIEQDGYHLDHRGRYCKCAEHDSLVVDTAEQSYYWNSQDEHGDVINWVEKRRGVEFKTAVEELCRRSNLPDPDWGKQDAKTRLATRAKEDAFEVASRVFEKWLWGNRDAIDYAKGRGWNEEIIKAHRLGFSGEGTPEERKEMSGELSMAGVDLKSTAAVAITGMLGGISRWAKEQQIDLTDYKDWIEKDYIPGLVGHEGLIYPPYQRRAS